MAVARVYVLMGAVAALVALHWLCTRYARFREGYSVSAAQASAAQAVNKQNTSDLQQLQRQVQDLEQMRQQIIATAAGIKGHQDMIKKITKQTTQIGPGKTISSVKVSKSQSQALQQKAKS
tara:strand:- start:117 stop:479 length:363 start_codon:yes stop_codon:yes gene_type:complete